MEIIEHQKKWLISLPVDIIEKQIDSTQKTYMRDPEWIPYIFYTKIEDITEKESKILRLVSINENEIEQFFSKSHVYDRYIEIHISYVILALKDLNLEALKRAIFLQWYAQAKPYYISGIKTLNHNYEIKAMDKMIEDYQKDVLDEEFKIMLIHYYKFMDDIFSNYKNFDKISDLFSPENLKKSTYDPLKKYSYKNRGRMGMYWSNILKPDTD